MADAMDIWVTCSSCSGTGLAVRTKMDADGKPLPETETYPCSTCNGEGKYVESAGDATDIMDKLQKIKKQTNDIEKLCNDIWDKVNV